MITHKTEGREAIFFGDIFKVLPSIISRADISFSASFVAVFLLHPASASWLKLHRC
jgi:hypothetical protein